MMIMNPLSGGAIANLFSTHPATHNRVEALLRLGVGQATRGRVGTAVPAGDGRRIGPWS